MTNSRLPRSGRGAPEIPEAHTRPIRNSVSLETSEGSAPERLLRIAGLPAVAALFKSSPERVLRLFYEDRLVPEVGRLCSLMAKLRRPYRCVDTAELTKIAGTALHGGLVAIAKPRPVESFDPVKAQQWAASRQALIVLDGIGNPHNLGAIARTLAFFGFERLVMSDHPEQAGLSDAAYRVAQGGLDALEVYRATQLPAMLQALKPAYRVIGTALTRHGLPLETVGDDPRPVALVLGNEEHGLPRATLAACDAIITLQGAGAVQSLNVAATAAILAYALRPRPKSAPPRRVRPATGRATRNEHDPPKHRPPR